MAVTSPMPTSDTPKFGAAHSAPAVNPQDPGANDALSARSKKRMGSLGSGMQPVETADGSAKSAGGGENLKRGAPKPRNQSPQAEKTLEGSETLSMR